MTIMPLDMQGSSGIRGMNQGHGGKVVRVMQGSSGMRVMAVGMHWGKQVMSESQR